MISSEKYSISYYVNQGGKQWIKNQYLYQISRGSVNTPYRELKLQTLQQKLSSYKILHFGLTKNQPFLGILMRAALHRDLGGNHALLGRGAAKAGLSRYHTKQAQSESYTVTDRASASTVAPPRT